MYKENVAFKKRSQKPGAVGLNVTNSKAPEWKGPVTLNVANSKAWEWRPNKLKCNQQQGARVKRPGKPKRNQQQGVSAKRRKVAVVLTWFNILSFSSTLATASLSSTSLSSFSISSWAKRAGSVSAMLRSLGARSVRCQTHTHMSTFACCKNMHAIINDRHFIG